MLLNALLLYSTISALLKIYDPLVSQLDWKGKDHEGILACKTKICNLNIKIG